jgi:urea transporter
MKMITANIKNNLSFFIEGIFNSYSQVFFSKNKVFAGIILLITFFDVISGFSGLIATMTANLAAIFIGFNKDSTRQGYFGFNSLLVGLGIGVFFQPGFAFFFVLIFASLLTFFFTIWMSGIFAKYGLPYLSWPFLFGIWMVTLASRQFTALEISERGIYFINEIYTIGGIPMVKMHDWLGNLRIHESIKIYFKSLGAIFFQYHLLAGLLVAAGLIIYSRIAFLLSVTGFFSAYIYYLIIGANLNELSYGYIGFNYILTAIAMGGIFVIPSRYSFLSVLLLTPLISFIITSTISFFIPLQLSIFSLAFNIVVVLFLYVLKLRERNFKRPELVAVQQYSPEKNLYSQKNYQARFDMNAYVQVVLPFWGEWGITQGHNGNLTHRDEWRHAWDFEVFDEDGQRYSDTGKFVEDYNCFNKPVTAPADGIIQEIEDGIADNKVGEVNIEKNWGNTVVIKHHETLYTKLSHLKKGSIKVEKGAFIKRGEIVGICGNSGRSPEPHLHFQFQSTPFIGSKTLDYPIAKYILKTDKGFILKTYDRPKEGQIVCNISKDDSMFTAYNFVPGQKITFEVTKNNGLKEITDWEIKSDYYNNTYFECTKTGSTAWFKNDGTIFYFTHFNGDRSSFLYYFYLGSYKVVLGYYKNLAVDDVYPLAIFRNHLMKFIQDFVAPFHIFMKAGYELRYLNMMDDLSSSSIHLESTVKMSYLRHVHQQVDFDILIENGRISRFEFRDKNNHIFATEIQS